MLTKIYSLLVLGILCTTFPVYSQSLAPIHFDIRGRDCDGGIGICSAKKTNKSDGNISIQKIDEDTFVLSILRASLTLNEETSIAGQSFSEFHAKFPKSFAQNGDFYFSDEVLETLGIDSKYNLLREGVYPMRIDKDFVKITLTLTEVSKN